MAVGAGQHTLRCPPHFPGEVVNALYQKLRSQDPQKHLPAPDAQRAVTQFLATVQRGVMVTHMPGLYQQAFEFAQTYQLPSIYDAIYVVLARGVQGELWTDDRRLLAMLGNRAPWVRWIGDYPV